MKMDFNTGVEALGMLRKVSPERRKKEPKNKISLEYLEPTTCICMYFPSFFCPFKGEGGTQTGD